MKYILFTFFIIGLTLSGLSQQDTTKLLLDTTLIKQSKNKAAQPHLKCIAYGGIGTGGNSKKQGLTGAFGLNFHYSLHTLNAYFSYGSKSEEISQGFDWTPTLQSFNCGFMYGVGLYRKHIALSGGIGIGYTHTNMILLDPDHRIPQTGPNWGGISGYYTSVTYSNATGCAGLQLTFHGAFIGFTIQSLLNFSNTVTNYAIIGGISIGVQ